MELPTFSFKQVEAILAETFAIVPAKRGTFTARLQQLQKLGLPRGSNSGRGQRVSYESWQLCDLQFYLDLIQVGIPPALIAARFRGLGFYSVDGAGRFAEAAGEAGQPYFVHVRFNALAHLTSASEGVSESDPGYNEFSGGRDLVKVIGLAREKPGVVLNLAARLVALKTALATAEPSLADRALFVHYQGELD